MLEIPTRTIDFKHGNSWSVRDGTSETQINEAQLLHAAITGGHRGMKGRRAMLDEDDWLAEKNRKQATFEGIIKNQSIAQGNGLRSAARLVPRKSLSTLDPSEKGILNYQFGMTMATAWVRKKLGVPWLLHLDVYWEALGMPRLTGKRGDMIGLHPDGRWIAVEAKGFKRKPTRTQQTEAKDQAKQITNIGGAKPALHLAVLSFFAPDPLATVRPKPEVAHIWAVDPPSEDDSLFGELQYLTAEKFLKLYYEPWLLLFGDTRAIRKSESFLWLEPPNSNLRIGILPDVLRALDSGDYLAVPKHVHLAEKELSFTRDHPSWVGDGIVVEQF